MKILRIDASSRFELSHSREFAGLIEKRLLALYPGATVVVRDIINTPIPHITQDTIQAFETLEPQNDAQTRALQLSDELIDELLDTDILLISAPIYNFSVPSALKAYIDHIVRPKKTFVYEEDGPIGLVKGKRCFVVTALGAVYTGSELEGLNFLTPYLKVLLEFLGFEDIEFIQIEGTDLDPALLQACKEKAKLRIAEIQ